MALTRRTPQGKAVLKNRRSTRLHDRGLLWLAKSACRLAVAPSSKFRVGAALLTSDGMVYTGCNIESPVYLGICAERVALFKAISEGAQHFTTLAISCEQGIPCLPCGTCRQLLWEFAPSIKVIVADKQGSPHVHGMKDLLPVPFQRAEHDSGNSQSR